MQHLAGFREVLPSILVALASEGSDTPRRHKRTEENSREAVYVDDDVFFVVVTYGFGSSSMRPLRMARMAAWVRSYTCSLWKMFRT